MGKVHDGKLHDRVGLGMFSGLCLAACMGLLAAEHMSGVKDTDSEPSTRAPIYTIDAKASAAPGAPFPELVVAGQSVEFGKFAQVGFSTDAGGRGSFPMKIAKRGAKEGSSYPMAISWQLAPKSLLWVGNERVEVSGLRPNASYEMEVALFERTGLGYVMEPSPAYPDCMGGCVAAFGVPLLRDVKADSAASAAKKIEVRALSELPWGSPLLLAWGLALWRLGGAAAWRKAQTAAGLEPSSPMPVKSPKAG